MQQQKTADICAHLGDNYDRFEGAIVPPLFQNTLFTRKRKQFGYQYTRINNPTVEILEGKLAALEGAGAARVFSSGMGAITALLHSLLKQGDHVVLLRSAYFPVSTYLREEMKKFGVETDLAETFSEEEMERLTRPNTVLYYLESPSSNIFRILDLRRIASFAGKRGIKTAIDNTWATPVYQNPLAFGIDYVIHSATKYIGGHSDVVAGAVMGDQKNMDQLRHRERANLGSCLDPFAAWLLLRSLRTLEVRMERHSRNAAKVAAFLEGHEKVKKVYYPGLPSHENYELGRRQMRGYSGLMSFVLDTDRENAWKFVKGLRLFEEGPSWGGYESVMNTPGLFGEEKLWKEEGIKEGLIRISVGLEDGDSLVEDLEQSLKAL